MHVTGTHPHRKIIVHRENGTPAMPENTPTVSAALSALPDPVATDFTLRVATAVYRGLVATVGGVQMDGTRLRTCVYALLQVRAPWIYMGVPVPEHWEEDDELFTAVRMFVLDAISRNTPDPENLDELHDPDKWLIPTRPEV